MKNQYALALASLMDNRLRAFYLIIVILFGGGATILSQTVRVTDVDSNTLLEIIDEGNVGSILLPDTTQGPIDVTNKLYNISWRILHNV